VGSAPGNVHIVGRHRERQVFERLLNQEAPEQVLLLRGATGMGKSSILRLLEERCRRAEPPIDVASLSADSTHEQIVAAFSHAPPPGVVLVDDFDRLTQDAHAAVSAFVPHFVDSGGIVAVTSRVRPDLGGSLNPETVVELDVAPLEEAEFGELLRARGITGDSQLLGGILPVGAPMAHAVTFADLVGGDQRQQRSESLALDAVGRERDVYRIEATLRAGRGVLIAVVGQVGAGKSRLLRIVESRARSAGWSTAATDGAGELHVAPTTTPEAFVERTGALLSGQDAAFDRFVSSLESCAPTLVIIDGFRPHAEFASWLLDVVRPELAASASPVGLIVAGTHEELDDGVLAAADEVVELGPLDQLTVARHLRETAQDIDPPLTDDEIAAYVEAVCPQPELLESLTRALLLMSPSRTVSEPLLAEPDATG
jgi:hypothetical protein